MATRAWLLRSPGRHTGVRLSGDDVSERPDRGSPDDPRSRGRSPFVDLPLRVGRVGVHGCEIAYTRAVRRGAPTVVLVHGGSAHSGWWTETARQLASAYDVVLPDLSGHGESGHREEYQPDVWAEEIAVVIRHCGDRPAFIVGHSVGGLVGIHLAASAPRTVSGLVLVDTRLSRTSAHPNAGDKKADARRQPRIYETEEEGLARFRLVPGDTIAEPATIRRVAQDALRRVTDGWTWKADPRAVRRFTQQAVLERLSRVTCPVAYIYGEKSEFGGTASVRSLEQILGRPVPTRMVEGSYHHVPLDAPTECATAIGEIILGFGSQSRTPSPA